MSAKVEFQLEVKNLKESWIREAHTQHGFRIVEKQTSGLLSLGSRVKGPWETVLETYICIYIYI